MSKNRLLKAAVLLLIGTGTAFAQGTQTAPRPNQPPAAARPAPPAPAPAPATRAVPAQAAPAAQSTLVNLNTASAGELDKLPQIGPARAKDIIEARTKNGRFKDWNDFVARNVVPKNAEEAIKGKVRF